MKLTRHCEARKRQRGFSDFSLNIILKYGRLDPAAGGATKISFGNKEYQAAVRDLKRAIQMMDRAKGGNLVVINDFVLTMYKKDGSHC